ncbi:MAG: hypothetical protein GIS02_04305 [Methanosarcinales archaeon]|uniref:Periplasmic copper-binding protein NosD beta helix domain-containing protein n=1 Tax=Candidatus Ethanoperedens thermophilum TaxID=2766897 RepID=A0A848D9K1_9EURY|nr:hypothetical protein [Candidatus Ethanoperedens thermophilum]
MNMHKTADSINTHTYLLGCPRQVWLRLSKNNIVLDEQILYWGDLYSYYKNGYLVLNATSDGIFSSGGLWAASFSQINQYNETTHDSVLNESFYLFKNADVSGKNNWSLHENYSLSVIGIDAEASPRQVWLQLSKNDVPVDDKILCGWDYYNYSKNGGLVITSKVRDVFKGYESTLVTLDNVYQYSETTPYSELINNASHSYSTGNLKGVNWSLCENCSLSVIGIDAEASPRQMWLRFTKNNMTVDEKVITDGDNYTYYKNGQLIFTAYLDSIFAGVTTDMIQFKQVRQYSESGTPLMETNKKTLVASSPTQSGYNKGVLLYHSHENKISNNLIKSHFCGIGATDSSNNMLTNNTALNNDYGIKLEDSSNNKIYLNNLINNTNYNAYDTSTNQWNTSSKGNYYSDYTGSDNNSNGIGDDPHPIPGGNSIDHFPLMHPWGETPPLKGDLDDDSQITSTDAAIVLEIAVGSRFCDSETLVIADVSGDGRVSSLDALIILQMAAGAMDLS